MSDTTPSAAPAPAEATPNTTPPSAAPTPPAPSSEGEQGDTAAQVARLEHQLAEARAEAGKSRVTAKQRAADEARTQLAQEIGRALGLVGDEATPDPAALTQQLAAEQQQARQAAVELAVYRAAGAAGADPDALLDSRQFATLAAGLDPADTAAVQAAITDAIKTNPRLAAAPATPARSGSEFPGAPAAPQRPASLRDAIAARLNP
ncbi:hypothetical protein ACIQU6_40320 [Streptomyces sp. NPDC090442]|uniref:hypothetical protein n=1 Tax=Streptomyces sp. NPDC090442 TaxID=3365962 RepID=UPI0038083DAF